MLGGDFIENFNARYRILNKKNHLKKVKIVVVLTDLDFFSTKIHIATAVKAALCTHFTYSKIIHTNDNRSLKNISNSIKSPPPPPPPPQPQQKHLTQQN